MTTTLTAAAMDTRAALGDLTGIQTDIYAILLSVVLIVLAVLAVRALIKSDWGFLVAELAGAVVVLWILLNPTGFQNVLAGIGTSVFGG